MSYTFSPSGAQFLDPLVQEGFKKLLSNGTVLTGEKLAEVRKTLKYPEYLAPHDPAEEGKYDSQVNPLHEVNDKGHLGDPTFKHLFKDPKVKTNDLSPNFGTEVEGVQLSELDDQGKNDLALFLETRGLAVFRDQDLRDKGPKAARDFASYFGPLHIHPVSFTAENHPELLVTYRAGGGPERYAKEFTGKTGAYGWHSDISFEEYPSSFSFFVCLEAPKSGGDTVFLDLREAYRRLSPAYQKFLETLTVVHTNYYQNLIQKASGLSARVKKDYFTEHPLVRTHPVTGEKSLFYSRAFIHSIKGLKPTESASVLRFLEDHVTNNPEIQVRAVHKGTDARTIIAWDNRFLLHTATVDFLQHETEARHFFRLTVLGERPYLNKPESEKEEKNGHENGNGHKK